MKKTLSMRADLHSFMVQRETGAKFPYQSLIPCSKIKLYLNIFIYVSPLETSL